MTPLRATAFKFLSMESKSVLKNFLLNSCNNIVFFGPIVWCFLLSSHPRTLCSSKQPKTARLDDILASLQGFHIFRHSRFSTLLRSRKLIQRNVTLPNMARILFSLANGTFR